MSSSSPSSSERTRTLAEEAVLPRLGRFGSGVKSSVTTLAFWTAVVLPFLHLPLLATGLDDGPILTAFVVLLVLNVVAAVVGQSYHRE